MSPGVRGNIITDPKCTPKQINARRADPCEPFDD